MQIQSVNNSPSMRSGLYFTNKNGLLNKINVTEDVVQISKDGFRYIEDTNLTQAIKNRFAQIPFIKELAEKFDTFVHFYEMPKSGKTNQFEYASFAKISWTNNIKNTAEKREFIGTSPLSQEAATEKMFTNIEKRRFAHISK